MAKKQNEIQAYQRRVLSNWLYVERTPRDPCKSGRLADIAMKTSFLKSNKTKVDFNFINVKNTYIITFVEACDVENALD